MHIIEHQPHLVDKKITCLLCWFVSYIQGAWVAVCHWKADSIVQHCSVLAQFPQKLEVSWCQYPCEVGLDSDANTHEEEDWKVCHCFGHHRRGPQQTQPVGHRGRNSTNWVIGQSVFFFVMLNDAGDRIFCYSTDWRTNLYHQAMDEWANVCVQNLGLIIYDCTQTDSCPVETKQE